MISEFTDILDYTKEKDDEDLGMRMLLYVFYCCDLTDNNPLRDVDYRLKEEQALSRAFPGRKKKFLKKEKEFLDAAIDAYNFFNETALERATLAYDKKIDEIRTLLENTKPEVHAVFEDHLCESCVMQGGEELSEVRVVDKYVSNDKIIANFAKQLTEMAVNKLKALETAKKIENTGRVRGDKGSSLIERGNFRKEGNK